jgi:outer membrane protein assembly factor BamB
VAWAATVPYYGSVMASDLEGTIVLGYDGEVTSLAPDGAELWATNEELEEVTNRPALVDGIVVVPSKDELVAIARSDGAPLWRAPFDEPRLEVGRDDGAAVVLASAPDGSITVLDPRTGTRLVEWSVPAPLPGGAPLLFPSDEVVIAAWGGSGRCCALAAFDASDGRQLWQRSLTDDSTEPMVHDGHVIVAMNGAHESRGRVVAFEAATGERRWRTAVRGVFRPTLASAAHHDLVVVVSRGGAALALDAGTGMLRWRSRAMIADSTADPQIAVDLVFLTPHSTDLVAFDRRSGEVVGAGPIEQTIVITDSNVVDGRFQMLVTNGFEGQVWNLEPGRPRAG